MQKTFTKTLSAVEAEPDRSHQHEFNGVGQLKTMLGTDRKSVEALFSVRGGKGPYQTVLTWYDAREKHAVRSEHRLYFKTNPVMKAANEGDKVVFSLNDDGVLHCELVKAVP